MSTFQTLVINVEKRVERRENMEKRLSEKSIQHEFVKAIEPSSFPIDTKLYLTETAEAVWRSHLECLKLASKNPVPTLILEDDAVLDFDLNYLNNCVQLMVQHNIHFLQIGHLKINIAESSSILVRNLYSYFTKNALASKFFTFFGFKEVSRAKSQVWRKSLPNAFVVNDIRYGAHCYLVSPDFAREVISLNSPAFLPADDFYVALGHSKTYRMIRLLKSHSSQDGTPSSFTKRFLLS